MGWGGGVGGEPCGARHCHVPVLVMQPSRLDHYMAAKVHMGRLGGGWVGWGLGLVRVGWLKWG